MVTKPAGFRQDTKTMDATEALNVSIEIAKILSLGYDTVVPLVVRAFRGRAWLALGYTSWEEYCREHFSAEGMLRLPDSVVYELAGEGLSARAIAAATGRSKSDVGRRVRDAERPDNVVSLDGFRRPARGERTPAESRAAHPAGKRSAVPAWQVVVDVVANAEAGVTYIDVCDALGWRDGKVTGALSEASRRGEIRVTGERDGHAVWVVTPCED